MPGYLGTDLSFRHLGCDISYQITVGTGMNVKLETSIIAGNCSAWHENKVSQATKSNVELQWLSA